MLCCQVFLSFIVLQYQKASRKIQAFMVPSCKYYLDTDSVYCQQYTSNSNYKDSYVRASSLWTIPRMYCKKQYIPHNTHTSLQKQTIVTFSKPTFKSFTLLAVFSLRNLSLVNVHVATNSLYIVFLFYFHVTTSLLWADMLILLYHKDVIVALWIKEINSLQNDSLPHWTRKWTEPQPIMSEVGHTTACIP